MRNNLVKFSAALGLLAILALPALAFAQTQISVGIPGSYANNTSTAPGAYIANFYQFALLIGGILAFGAIVFGGVKYVASAGNPSAQSDGKEWIWGALIGLLLLAGAYLILKVINPQLLNLNLPTLNAISAANTTTPPPQMEYGCVAANGTVACSPGNKSDCSDVPNGACSGLSCTQVQTSQCGTVPTGTCQVPALPAVEPPSPGSQTFSDPNNSGVQQNLSALQTAYGKFQAAIKTVGDSVVSVNSVYRPVAYQKYLYDIYLDAMALHNNPSASTNSACTSIISNLTAEENKHGICVGGYPATAGHSCLVSNSNCPPHSEGIGMDISIKGPVSNSGLSATLQSNNVGMQFQGLPGDPVHFQLTTTNEPGGSCPDPASNYP